MISHSKWVKIDVENYPHYLGIVLRYYSPRIARFSWMEIFLRRQQHHTIAYLGPVGYFIFAPLPILCPDPFLLKTTGTVFMPIALNFWISSTFHTPQFFTNIAKTDWIKPAGSKKKCFSSFFLRPWVSELAWTLSKSTKTSTKFLSSFLKLRF
jgi:hypothetical protein